MKKILILAFLGISLIGCSNNTSSSDSITEAITEATESVTAVEEKISTESEDEYKEQCSSFDYKEYFRYEDKYKGSMVKLTVQVSQIADTGIYRCYTLDSDGFLMDEYLIMDNRESNDFKVLADDIINVWGKYIESSKVNRAISETDDDIFTVEARYIELADDTALSDNMGSDNPDSAEYLGNAKADSYYEEDLNEYILPFSNSSILTDSDLYGLTNSELKIAKNEIYARHGRRFKDNTLQEHFNGKSWYEGIIEPEQFDENVLSEIEKSNVQIIHAYLNGASKSNPNFDMARITDKYYINGSSEDSFEIYFYLEGRQIFFTISRFDSDILRMCNAQVIDSNTLNFRADEMGCDLNFIWNGDNTFIVTGQGEAVTDMINSEFFDVSAFSNAS